MRPPRRRISPAQYYRALSTNPSEPVADHSTYSCGERHPQPLLVSKRRRCTQLGASSRRRHLHWRCNCSAQVARRTIVVKGEVPVSALVFYWQSRLGRAALSLHREAARSDDVRVTTKETGRQNADKRAQ
ncbi:hypothetical protein MRX96_056986 [Rhipicephalus microplus]